MNFVRFNSSKDMVEEDICDLQPRRENPVEAEHRGSNAGTLGEGPEALA